MSRHTVLISGSRKWTDWELIKFRLSLYPKGTIVLHGAAIGADTIAHEWAVKLKMIPHPLPYFGDHGKAGGDKRNEALVWHLDVHRRFGAVCAAETFPLDTGGTWNCIRWLDKLNRKLKRTDQQLVPVFVKGAEHVLVA